MLLDRVGDPGQRVQRLAEAFALAAHPAPASSPGGGGAARVFSPCCLALRHQPASRRPVVARVGVLDDEARLEPRHLTRQPGPLHRVEHGVEVLAGGGRLVLRTRAAVGQEVVDHELGVHRPLVEWGCSPVVASTSRRNFAPGWGTWPAFRDRAPPRPRPWLRRWADFSASGGPLPADMGATVWNASICEGPGFAGFGTGLAREPDWPNFRP